LDGLHGTFPPSRQHLGKAVACPPGPTLRPTGAPPRAMALVRLGLSLKGRSPMLRLVLLLLYLFSSSSTGPHAKQGGSADPLGLTSPQGAVTPVSNPNPPSNNTDQGGGIDPLG
jgi:hypothetical protein